uniref:Putative replicase n=1 Tax=Kensystermes virus TaxID=2796602 RepID=A0A7T7GUU4_9VIRU|nr:putative replicase [Kensystermes virus]
MTTVHFLISLSLWVQWHLYSFLNRNESLRKAAHDKASAKVSTFVDPKDLEVGKTVYKFCIAICPKGATRGILRGIHLAHTRKLKKLHSHVVALQLKDDFLLIKNFFLIGRISGVKQTPLWRKSDRIGVPPYLSPIIKTNNFNWLEKVLLITYLRSYKSMETWSERPDLSTILLPITPIQYLNVLWTCYRGIFVWMDLGLPTHRYSNVKPRDFVSHQMSLEIVSQISAIGPSGGSILSRVIDLTNVIRSPFRLILIGLLWNLIVFYVTKEPHVTEKVFKRGAWKPFHNFETWVQEVSNLKGLGLILDKLDPKTQHHLSYQKRLLNRLAIFPDGIGKLRYVALSDFPTQSVLKSLHNLIFRLLQNTNSDATFNQGKIYDWYNEHKDKPLYSLDLSAATDRLPLPLQSILLGKIFGSYLLGLVWMVLMMTCKFAISRNPGFVRYSVGQGIGIYSSWAILAYTNHFMVRVAAYNVGHMRFSDYLVLGDDVVIANHNVAREYHNLITRLGVRISIPKSVIRSPEYKSLEFASKLIVNEKDISPFPVGTILESRKNLSSLLTLWSQLVGRALYSDYRELECMTSPDLGPTFPLSGKEGVQSLFGVYYTYINMYIDSQLGSVSGGFRKELPFDSSLNIVWERTSLTWYQGLDKQVSNEIRKKFIRALRLVLRYTLNARILEEIANILTYEVLQKTDRGNQRSAPSHDLLWAAGYLARPWFVVKTKAVELLSQVTGVDHGFSLSHGRGVILLNDRQFINDYLTLLNKGPGFRLLGLREEDYLNLVRLSLGPKSVFLGGQTWIDKVLPGQKPGRKSKHTLVQVTRKNFLVTAINRLLVGKRHKRVSSPK